jgi:hypothetical protein
MVLFYPNHSVSQGDYTNHKKYWYYKTRLNNDFVKVGTGQGESMPLNERGWGDYAAPFDYNAETMQIGDGSARLGIYLAALATEYRLLKNNGQDVTKVKHEIFCALNAINRIDYKAECYLGNPNNAGCFPNLNGFFIRDDVPKNIVKNNYKHFNYYNNGLNQNGDPNNQNQDKGFTQTYNKGMTKVRSSYQSFVQDYDYSKTYQQNLHTKEESQDQVYYLLMGLSLTSGLVDANETDNGASFSTPEVPTASGTLLADQARQISNRLLAYIAQDPGWKIRNPVNIDNSNLSGKPVDIGADASVYSYALDNAGCFIRYGQDLPSVHIGPGLPYNGCTDYRQNFSGTLPARTLWQGVVAANGGLTVDQNGFFHALGGICNCIYDDAVAVNLNILNQITTLTNQISQLNAQMAQAIQTYINNLPNWAKPLAWVLNWTLNAINNIINVFNSAINAISATIQSLYNQLSIGVKLNTSEYRLIQNTKVNATPYTDCITTSHTGSDAYFGLYLRDALRLNNPNYNTLPNWLQVTLPAGIPRSTIDNEMKNILDAAPCMGNYYMHPSKPSPFWGASNRIDRQDGLWKTCVSGNQGEYQGTDYMLLHNLYYLTKGTNVPVSDYSDRKITLNLPFNNIFTNNNVGTIGAFEYITGLNTISANGGVNYRAGKEVTLLPGFTAAAGSEFRAHIQPFAGTCNNDAMSKTTSESQLPEMYEGPTDMPGKPVTNNTIPGTIHDDPQNTYMENFNGALQHFLDSLKTGIPQNDFEAHTVIFPNPNSGEFTINFNLKEKEQVEVMIVDIMGREVFNFKGEVDYKNLEVNLKEYSKGIYIVKLKNSNGYEFTKKIAIQ